MEVNTGVVIFIFSPAALPPKMYPASALKAATPALAGLTLLCAAWPAGGCELLACVEVAGVDDDADDGDGADAAVAVAAVGSSAHSATK